MTIPAGGIAAASYRDHSRPFDHPFPFRFILVVTGQAALLRFSTYW